MRRRPLNDRYERRHRRTAAHPESIATMANADFSRVPSLSEAMGLEPIHLHPGGLLDAGLPALCGWQPAPGVQMIPAKHWNGKTDGVCEECVKVHHAAKA